MEMWNYKYVLPPPVNTFLCNNKTDIKVLIHTTKNIIQILTKQSPLHKESAIFSRFLYKFDKKFRNDIGYRNFKKVNTALKKYLTLNLLKDIESFASILPNKDDDGHYLPTRQMLEYVLVRIMTFAKLMLRIVVCSKQAAIFYLDRIKRGESHWMSLMPYALLSRIWSMTQVLLQHSCNWYNQLHPILELLQPKGLNFLSLEDKMPDDLEIWCDLKNLNNFGRFEWSNKVKINIEPIILEDTDDNLCENILKYVNKTNETEENPKEYRKSLSPLKNKLDDKEINLFLNKTDVGVAISRDKLKKSDLMESPKNNIVPSLTQTDSGMLTSRDTSKILKVKKTAADVALSIKPLNNFDDTSYDHAIDKVTNNYSLKQFINKEEEYRIENEDKALTGHLSFMQWHTLKTSLLKLTESEILPRKLQRKTINIWNDKCLYYK